LGSAEYFSRSTRLRPRLTIRREGTTATARMVRDLHFDMEWLQACRNWAAADAVLLSDLRTASAAKPAPAVD